MGVPGRLVPEGMLRSWEDYAYMLSGSVSSSEASVAVGTNFAQYLWSGFGQGLSLAL